jgi:hypothetical protein
MPRECSPLDPLAELLRRAARLADDPSVRKWCRRLAARGEGGRVPPAPREEAKERTTTTRSDEPRVRPLEP